MAEQKTGIRQEHYRLLARYNEWANTRLYDAAARCDPAALAADRGGFFGSLLGVLNHMMVTDGMWMARIADGVSPRGTKLNEIPHEDFHALCTARQALDTSIIAHVESLDEASLAGTLTYATSTGAPFTQPLRHVLAHFFNHQTHHRDQAHHLVGLALGQKETPVLDLMAYQRSLLRAAGP